MPLKDLELVLLARHCVEAALRKDRRIALVESLTGGLIGAAIAAIPGASGMFEGSMVPYSNDAKSRLTGDAGVFIEHGSVSAEAAMAMAQAMLIESGVDLVAASTGIAGPDGGTPKKPIGLVFIALAAKDGFQDTMEMRLGDHLSREEIVSATAMMVLKRLGELIG
jgi:nicotinamide-nucleotide amidase